MMFVFAFGITVGAFIGTVASSEIKALFFKLYKSTKNWLDGQ